MCLLQEASTIAAQAVAATACTACVDPSNGPFSWPPFDALSSSNAIVSGMDPGIFAARFCIVGNGCLDFVNANCPRAQSGQVSVWSIGMNAQVCSRRYYKDLRAKNPTVGASNVAIFNDLQSIVQTVCMPVLAPVFNTTAVQQCGTLLTRLEACNIDPDVYHKDVCSHQITVEVNRMVWQRGVYGCTVALGQKPCASSKAQWQSAFDRCVNACPGATFTWGSSCYSSIKAFVVAAGAKWPAGF